MDIAGSTVETWAFPGLAVLSAADLDERSWNAMVVKGLWKTMLCYLQAQSMWLATAICNTLTLA